MLNYEYPPLGGGAANATACLLREFGTEPGLRVDLVTSSTGSRHVEHLAPGITGHFLDIGKRGSLHHQRSVELLRYSWRAALMARRLVARHCYDLCHAFFGIPCGVVASWLPLPFIVSLRGSDVPFYNPRFRWADRLLFQHITRHVWRRATAVVANSKGLRRLALQTSPEQDIRVIPNGVDTGIYRPAPTPGGPLHVLCVARLTGRKRVEDLLRALARLPEGDVRCTVVGEGPRRAPLQVLADELGLANVEFAGRVPRRHMPAVYRSADVFVLPSLMEGMSNTVLEAMASGLPVVLTPAGGTDELLTSGENGRLVPHRDPEALADALRGYLNDPALAARHGRAARRRARTMRWGRVAGQYLSLYDTIRRTREPS
jgi:glycosyltransferase involved in cell wall biosynthesis